MLKMLFFTPIVSAFLYHKDISYIIKVLKNVIVKSSVLCVMIYYGMVCLFVFFISSHKYVVLQTFMSIL